MIHNITNQQDIDFNKGICIETLDAKLTMIRNKLNIFKSPYVGNKRKLIIKLVKTLEKYKIKYDSILDLFAGSGFISIAMKLLGKKVYANDLLISSYFNIISFVKNNSVILSDDEKKFILHNNELVEPLLFLKKYKKRFTDNELLFLSNYRNNVVKLWGEPLNFSCIKSVLAFSYLQNYIIEKCFVGGRLSNNQILARKEHRLNHQRNAHREMTSRDIRWTKPLLAENNNSHYCYNSDAIVLLDKQQIKVDICYIDPPYGGLSSDYSEMYQFFEEYIYKIPYRDIPSIKTYGDRFVNKHNYENNFNLLLSASKYIPWIIISYNDSSWNNIDDICNIINKYRDKIIVEEFSYKYKYRGRDGNTEKTREYLILSH